MTPVRSKPESCAGCQCERHGADFSQIEGTGASGVMLCGEASGEHEQRDQLPFRPYAPAGSLLERTFRRMGLDRQQFSITNTIRCRPRNNWLEGAPWEHAALAHCRPNLDAAIGLRRPRCLVALGGTALRELTGEAGEARGVSHLAGYVLPYPTIDPAQSIPVVPNFHPAFLRRGNASLQGVFARILQRAINVAAGRDRNYLWGVDPADRSTHGTGSLALDYQTHPSLDAAESFAAQVLLQTDAVVSYDIETAESASLDEDAREGFVDTHIQLIQFCMESGRAIAFPWTGRYREIARDILLGPNVKCGHNVWLFDNKVLRAAGEREGLDLRPRGVIRDTLQMFHHWQPDLPAHLQFAAQFVSFPFPWKHLAAGAIEFYGCADVDATLRLHRMLEETLKRDGIWGGDEINATGYIGQLEAVRPVLAAMEDRGLPIDDAARLALDAEFDAAQQVLGDELAAAAPDACRRVHPKQGYKGVPPEIRDWNHLDTSTHEALKLRRLNDESDGSGEWYHYELRPFDAANIDEQGNPVIDRVMRWCRVYDFNPNSAQQLLLYMDARKHKRPKGKQEDADGNAKDTTAKKELQRLARKHNDPFYLKVIEYRELSKMRGTYIDGFRPAGDGRVHTSFTFDTGTGQLTSRNPNVQNFPKHGRLAKAVRAMVAAPAGHLILEADYKSYHVLTTGYCARDASYMRLARLDMHSFVAGDFLRCWDAERIIEEPDDALRDRFKWFKMDVHRKRVRDKQAKPSILGIGFGMGYRRLYQENLEHFPSERIAKQFHDLLRRLFPKIFAWQQEVRQLAHRQQYLRSPFGHMRRFYEVFRWDHRKGDWAPGDQAEEAVAFLPANIAFGAIREVMKDLARRGLDERFGLCNNVHDSFVFVFPEALREDFLQEVIPVLTAPSRVLIDPAVAPGGLSVEVEAAAGPNWSAMQELTLPKSSCATLTPIRL